MENMVANEGFVRGYRREQQRLTVGATMYRLDPGVVLPDGTRELRVRDLILVAAAGVGEFSRDDLLRRGGVDGPAGRRAFAQLIRERVIVRPTGAKVVHVGRHAQVLAGEPLSVLGRVFSVTKNHPAKRQINLDLEDGSRAVVLAYGPEAVKAARLGRATYVRVTGIKLKSRPCLYVRATSLHVALGLV